MDYVSLHDHNTGITQTFEVRPASAESRRIAKMTAEEMLRILTDRANIEKDRKTFREALRSGEAGGWSGEGAKRARKTVLAIQEKHPDDIEFLIQRASVERSFGAFVRSASLLRKAYDQGNDRARDIVEEAFLFPVIVEIVNADGRVRPHNAALIFEFRPEMVEILEKKFPDSPGKEFREFRKTMADILQLVEKAMKEESGFPSSNAGGTK